MEAEQQQEFDKAFAATMTDEIEDVKVEEPVAPVEEEVIVEPERVEVIDGFTKEELKEQLALIPKLQKAIDTTNGTYGARLAELNKTIESLKAKPEEGEVESTTGNVTLDALKEEYPDIAELLAKDLQGRSGGGEDVVKVVEAKFAEERATREQAETEKARKRLARAHPDFRDIALYTVEDGIVRFPDPKFGEWLSNQPKDKFELVIGSKDADDLSDVLTEYKNSSKPVGQKRSSLEAAILPKGNGLTGRTMTEKEMEEAAYRAEMAADN